MSGPKVLGYAECLTCDRQFWGPDAAAFAQAHADVHLHRAVSTVTTVTEHEPRDVAFKAVVDVWLAGAQ